MHRKYDIIFCLITYISYWVISTISTNFDKTFFLVNGTKLHLVSDSVNLFSVEIVVITIWFVKQKFLLLIWTSLIVYQTFDIKDEVMTWRFSANVQLRYLEFWRNHVEHCFNFRMNPIQSNFPCNVQEMIVIQQFFSEFIYKSCIQMYYFILPRVFSSFSSS